METEQLEKGRCHICGTSIEVKPADPNETRPPWFMNTLVCYHCRKTYPPSLIKACSDSFHYILRIRGVRDDVDFTHAKIHGNWVTIYDRDNVDGVEIDGKSYARGFDIALSEIVGCSDAPDIPFLKRVNRTVDDSTR